MTMTTMPSPADQTCSPIDPELAYYERRAREERARATACENIWARAAHHELALAYERRIWRRDPQMIQTMRVRANG